MERMFKKLLNFINFDNLSIKQKFFLFSIGSLFWLMLVSALSLMTIYKMSTISEQMVEDIVPEERVLNSVIRKLRGASISVHKMMLYDDKEIINENYSKGIERLNDCHKYLNTLLKGGTIKDYSIGTGLLLDEFTVSPLTEEKKIELIESVIVKIDKLQRDLNEIANKRLKGEKINSVSEKLFEYDSITREIVKTLHEHSIDIYKEWDIFTDIMKKRFDTAIILISFIFLITATLSGVFVFLMSRSLVIKIKEIIEQFKKLSSGDIELSKKLDIESKDEVGMLAKEFNKIMDNVVSLASFKKIIEEDEVVEDIYIRLGRIFRDEFNFEKIIIFEVSNSKNNMRVVFPTDEENFQLYCNREILLDCELCRTKRTGHQVSSVDSPKICKYYSEAKDVIHVCIPIILGGSVGGIVQFICSKRDECDKEELNKKIKRAMQYINEAQPVIEAKRLMKALKESSFKDALTGLYNRRFLEESFDNLVAGVLRRNSTLGLLMCDIDFFKQINDVYGHDTGDIVLREIAHNIKNTVRASDLVIRFGGEEFLVLLIDSEKGKAVEVAEKIRERIKETKIRISGGVIQKTISIGISEFPVDTQNFWGAIKFADVALYKAKETGRNRVVKFTADMWTEGSY